jgi:hypothetical protein
MQRKVHKEILAEWADGQIRGVPICEVGKCNMSAIINDVNQNRERTASATESEKPPREGPQTRIKQATTAAARLVLVLSMVEAAKTIGGDPSMG